MAYIGGGFGSKELKEKDLAGDDPPQPGLALLLKKRWERVEEFREKLGETGVEDYEIIQEEAGLWILIRKR